MECPLYFTKSSSPDRQPLFRKGLLHSPPWLFRAGPVKAVFPHDTLPPASHQRESAVARRLKPVRQLSGRWLRRWHFDFGRGILQGRRWDHIPAPEDSSVRWMRHPDIAGECRPSVPLLRTQPLRMLHLPRPGSRPQHRLQWRFSWQDSRWHWNYTKPETGHHQRAGIPAGGIEELQELLPTKNICYGGADGKFFKSSGISYLPYFVVQKSLERGLFPDEIKKTTGISDGFHYVIYFVNSNIISLLRLMNLVISSGESCLWLIMARSYNCWQIKDTCSPS